MESMREKLQHCFDRGVPIVAVTTADPAEVTKAALGLIDRENDPLPVIMHSTGCGFLAMNKQGQSALATAFGGGEYSADPSGITQPADALRESRNFPEGTILVLVHAHRWVSDMYAASALWVCRDNYKGSDRMAILTGPSIDFPTELQTDIIMIDSPLPTRDEAREQIERVYRDAKEECPELPDLNGVLDKALDAMSGLSQFAIEQTVAYAVRKDGLNLADLWQQKIKTIEQSKGLTIWTKPVDLSEVGGCNRIKEFLSKIIKAYGSGGVVWIDEIEKALAGSKGDTSGVTQDQLGVLLTFMQESGANGAIFVGPPGSAKSLLAKAAGSQTNLTIALDLGGSKSSLLGASEGQIRQNMKVINSVCNGKPFFIATCNSINSIPPELKRRFKAGIWFFNLPDEEERTSIFKIHLKKNSMDATDAEIASWVERSDGWTGAEIETAIGNAKLTGDSILEAMDDILPVSVSDPENLKALRSLAHNRFKSASYKGPYKMVEPTKETNRKIRLS